MSIFPYTETGIMSLMPTPAWMVVLKSKKSMIDSILESRLVCLNLCGVVL